MAARAVAYSVTDSTTPDVTLLFDPRYEDIDHRNVGYGTLSIEEARKLVASQRALADELRFRVEDILALRPDGLVRKTTTSGVWRDGGGAFERTVCLLSLFGADGRATRQRRSRRPRAGTLARFDALTLGLAPQPLRRRVLPCRDREWTGPCRRPRSGRRRRRRAGLTETFRCCITHRPPSAERVVGHGA